LEDCCREMICDSKSTSGRWHEKRRLAEFEMYPTHKARLLRRVISAAGDPLDGART
jgi:hypothetical protein